MSTDNSLYTKIEWLDAPGVAMPELAATWARYEMWVQGRCVSQVETTDTLRKSVYGSLYPLASWIASNWWLITSHIRPSAVEERRWNWSRVNSQPWLHYHNLRGAGDGMAWPNLTIVTEGAVASVVWQSDDEPVLGRPRFAVSGRAIVRSDEVVKGLASIVQDVLGRLSEQGLSKTPLAEEWEAIGRTDNDEREFCHAVARLGIDPYAVDDETAQSVVEAASVLPVELRADFFDSVDVAGIEDAAVWARAALVEAERAAADAMNLGVLYDAVSSVGTLSGIFDKPWEVGYAMARRVRQELNVSDRENFEMPAWVPLRTIDGPSRGLDGVTKVSSGRCGLATSVRPYSGGTAEVFRQARALGRVLAKPAQDVFVLSAARGFDERLARAFAAELLAPASGIQGVLSRLGRDDAALDAAARHFGVSPIVVRHQYDNQIADAGGPL